MITPSDVELLARVRAGDGCALGALLARYKAPLFQFLTAVLKDHHQAEDVLQETFVRALERLDGVAPDHFRGWLFTVAYHQAMLLKRRQKGQADPAAGTISDPAPGPMNLVAQREEARKVRELLRLLPVNQQEVIRQRVYEGKRFREIADTLGCPVNTALARMHEGIKRLRLLWEQGHA